MLLRNNSTSVANMEERMQMKKILFLKEYNIKNRFPKFPQKKIINSNLQNYERINDNYSIYVKEFKIIKMKEDNFKAPLKCDFNSLPENDICPFVSYKASNNAINLRNIKNIQEPNILMLDDISF